MGVKIQKLGIASLQTELLLLNQQKLIKYLGHLQKRVDSIAQ